MNRADAHAIFGASPSYRKFQVDTATESAPSHFQSRISNTIVQRACEDSPFLCFRLPDLFMER